MEIGFTVWSKCAEGTIRPPFGQTLLDALAFPMTGHRSILDRGRTLALIDTASVVLPWSSVSACGDATDAWRACAECAAALS